MRFDHMLIGFIILSLFFIGGTMMISDMNENYAGLNISNTSTEEFTDTYNVIDEMYNISKDSKEKTLEGDIADDTSWESMTKGSYSAIRLVSGSFRLVDTISSEIASVIGIPSFVVRIIFIIFSISITFSIIYMIFRFIPR